MARPRLISLIDGLYDGKEVFFRYIRYVEDVMSIGVMTLTLDNTLADARAFLKKHSVRHIPIVLSKQEGGTAEKPELVGLISQRDIARVSRGAGEGLVKQPLSEVVQRNVITVEPGDTLFEAIGIMVEKKFDCLPVVLGGEKSQELLGIVTSTDIIKCFFRMEVLRKTRQAEPQTARLIDFFRGDETRQPTEVLIEKLLGRVSDMMQDNPITVKGSDTLGFAMQLMEKHTFRHLPVVDSRNRLTGILSDRDVIASLPPPTRGRTPQRKGDSQPKGFRDWLFRIDPDDKDQRAALKVEVRNAMTANPVTAEPTTRLADIADIFCTRGFGAVPVIGGGGAANEGKTIIGIITQTDFLVGMLAIGRLIQDSPLATP